jgi:hypothetical protein
MDFSFPVTIGGGGLKILEEGLISPITNAVYYKIILKLSGKIKSMKC